MVLLCSVHFNITRSILDGEEDQLFRTAVFAQLGNVYFHIASLMICSLGKLSLLLHFLSF